MGELDPRSMRVVNMHYMEMAGGTTPAPAQDGGGGSRGEERSASVRGRNSP